MASQPNLPMINLQQRAAVLGNSVKMIQQIYSGSIDISAQNIVNIQPRNVGLVLGFLVEVSGDVTNGAATAADRTGLGSANIVRNFTFTDLNNVQRINTSGALIALLNSARQGFGFGGAYAPNLPMGYGNNWSPFAAPLQVAATDPATIKHTYWVPLAYSMNDLRGAIYASIVNATMNLQITLNQEATAFLAAGGNPLNAIYTGNANMDWDDNISINVYQVYLDQIPMQNGAPIVPLLDLNTIYDLKTTTVTGIAAGQDFPVPYANYRSFLSTFAIYNNGVQMNAGSDINYWSLVSANSTALMKVSPDIAALQARQTFMADPPSGVYYFDHRDKPIDTITFGNMEINLNASLVNANAQLIMGYEAFQMVNQIPVASSLSVGA
jgi:hypothetical protein